MAPVYYLLESISIIVFRSGLNYASMGFNIKAFFSCLKALFAYLGKVNTLSAPFIVSIVRGYTILENPLIK